jgi:hypothetical protein
MMSDGARRRARWWLSIAGAATVFAGAAGCATPGAALESSPAVTVTRVGAALHAPVWSPDRHTLVAITDAQRLAEVASPGGGDAATRLSVPMAVGANIQISTIDKQHVLVPEPAPARVAVVDLASLRQIGDFDAGPAPAHLTTDAGARILLALSADGSSVTPVQLYGLRKLATAQITPATAIEGSDRGRQIEYHVYGPSGISYYKGASSPPEKRGEFGMDIVAAAGDETKVTRSYVTDRNRQVLYALDSRRGGKGLEIVGRADVASAIRYLGTDDSRVFAATDRDLMVFETASITGYPRGKIPVLASIDYRTAMPVGSVRFAPPSGLAVAADRVYLTLRGQPYVIGVAKPRV